MLNMHLALKIAARLTVVKEFPRYQEAIDAVAEDLIDLTLDCHEDEAERRARWTIETVRRTWDEWSGQSELIRIYHKQFTPPRQIKSEDNEVKDWGVKPPINCQVCNDTGVLRLQSSGPYQWCECEAGILLHLDFPQWLEFINRVQPERVQPVPALLHPAASRPVSEEIEKHIMPAGECGACLEGRPHTHSEYWTHHTKQEIAE